ncbi:C40 family peptidase [Alicyclobacillus dauci]|uniref:NlpC/P60 family protein n=1 Tax=Alicyclobacillus dauci TaxID=1475485 RepID=A0ABY6Z0Z5_9BACL|nr:NlpC/P60 family protein [Alicyclobacillus dauci]WAH36548.1 NlpC/P60 family protein [Alicyclobacillus dauci]
MKYSTKVLSIGVSLLAGLAWNMPFAQAKSLSSEHQQLTQLQNERAQVQKNISADQAKANTVKATIAAYSNSLKALTSQINSSNAQLSSLQSAEKSLNDQLNRDQEQLKQQQNDLMQIIQAEYEDGNVSYLNVLFHATSFSDLLSRMYDISLVANQQNQVVNSVKKLKDAVVAKQAQVKSSEQKVSATKAQLVTLQQTQQNIKAQQQRDLVKIQSDIQSGKTKQGMLESQIQLTQSQIQAIEAQTQAAEQQASNPSYVRQQQASLVSADTSSLIKYAESFMGTPYVWGGTSPSGFDCSGFTQYVLGHFGVSINRTSEAQFASGMPVDRGNLQTGDLVFFSTYAPGATHVGIYIGNGLMVDSEDMGVSIDGVFNSYWGPKYIGARRYIK